MIFNFCHKNVPASELFADGERGRANWVTSNCVAHRICNETILCDEGIDNPSGAQRSSELLVRVLSGVAEINQHQTVWTGFHRSRWMCV